MDFSQTQTGMLMVRASSLKGYILTMLNLGVDPYSLLHDHNLSISLLENDDTLILQQSIVDLLEASSIKANCHDLGLRISTHQDISILGVLSIILQNALSMRKVIEYATNYLYLQGQDFTLSFNDTSPLVPNAFEIVFEANFKGLPPRQSIDLCIGTMHNHAKCLFGKEYGLRGVSFPYSTSVIRNTYKTFFDAPIYSNQERAALHISKNFLQITPEGANPILRQITEDYFKRHFCLRNENYSDRVKKALRLNLGTSQANKIEVSKLLTMHPRTLQRRLKDENTTFEKIKDNLKKDLAIYYIKHTAIPFYQLTSLLGFPEQSALSRATKRWFNLSPSELRMMK